MLVTSNGTGMGHLTRQSAVARALARRADVVVLSLSSGLPVVLQQGLRGEYLPSYQRPWFPRSDWHRYLADRLVALVHELDADVVAFDGVAPYRGLVLARRRLPATAFVWFRRGLWRHGVNRAALRAEPFFDLVIEPGDLSSAADRGATARRTAARVPPVSLLDVLAPLPRDEAAAALGLDPSRPAALVTLGSGALGHDEDAVAAALAAVRLHAPSWQLATTQSALSTQVAEHHDVHLLRGVYPLAQYVRAFDLVVSAAGYNAVHEFVAAGVPTVLVPNTHTSTDDQVARASHLDQAGLAVLSDPAQGTAGLTDAVARCLDRRADLAAAADVAPTGGAQAAAALLLSLAATDPSVHPLTRVRRARYLARATVVDGLLRLLGAANAERLRTWRRSGRPGLTHRLPVDVVEDPAAPRAEHATLLLTEHLDSLLVGRADPVEHLLAGASPSYRQERLAILRRAYDVRSGLPAPSA
ncbi:MAG TPA: glycosyltransferase [Mycobacteriales bacterium]|nr:glycosyltransferase [Mycobacteriales bacterium]